MARRLTWALLVGCVTLSLGVVSAAPRYGLPGLSSAECRPHWCEAGRPARAAYQAIDLLRAADAHGLAPDDYEVDRLEAQAMALAGATTPAPDDLAAFDTALGRSLLRYLSDLSGGRVDPHDVGFHYEAREDRPLAEHLSRAIAEDDLAGAVRAFEPRFAQYRRLKDALARYRALARDLALSPFTDVRRLREGEAYADLPQLARVLRALGDLPGDAAPLESSEVYGGEVLEAVRRFQARHGLEPDGVLGSETFRQLTVPLPLRVRQIELALERLRWLPAAPPGRLVVVNVPAFRLVGFESAGENRPVVQMGVVVGRAARWRTPLFAEDMRYLTFRPYWYPPLSIVRNEILPELLRDPAYLSAQDMEVVAAANDATALPWAQDTAAQLEIGTLRIRQRPGARNALGLVKFVFPNAYDVYLHDTPATGLFARARRDFSHGCIRVEDPLALAEFVLASEAGWTRARIEQAMRGESTLQVDLAVPIPVFIYYTTAIVRADGRIEFYDDIYGLDRALDDALRARTR